MLGANVAGLRGVASEERTVGDEIDESRHAMRAAIDLGHRLGTKPNLSARAGDVEPVVDVSVSLLLIEVRERAANGNALIELRHVRRANFVQELGLADKHDLNELFLIGFEI